MRAFALLLSTAALLLAQESFEVAGDLQSMTDRYLTAIAATHWKARAAQIAALHTPAEIASRQDYIRSRMREEIGGFPSKTPLNAHITGTLKRQGYRIEKLLYESLPRFYVTANVYVPDGPGPFPAVLGTAGHSDTGKAYPVYQRAWIALVKRGFLVIAYDPPGQGERLQYFDPALGRSRVGAGVSEHIMSGEQCLLTGHSIARYEIWDGVRAVDYLLTRPDVDPRRIAVVGNSGGGTPSAYLAVFEQRLAAAVPSCYITSWEKLWPGPGPQDSEQLFPNFLSDGFDFGDFLLAFAPKPIKVLTAIRDFFPIDGARATFAETRRLFDVLDRPAHIDFFEYDDPHGWSKPRREATAAWLEQWFHNSPGPAPEPEFETEAESALDVTSTGQVATDFRDAETIQSLNRAEAERVFAARSRAIPASLRHAGPRGVPPVFRRGEIGRDGYTIQKLALETEPGITVPVLLLVPARGEPRKPAVIHLNSQGKAADAAPNGDLEALALAGRVVLAPDARGWGETRTPGGRSGYGAAWQTAMRAILVGKNLPAMQVYDVLRAFDYLASRPNVDPARISVLGKHGGGPVALIAAALEPRFARIAVESAVPSYMEIVRAPLHENSTGLIVPGILRDMDLPDLAQQIAPRPLWVVDPRTPTGAPARIESVAAQYGSGAKAIERPAGWSFRRVYGGWLEP